MTSGVRVMRGDRGAFGIESESLKGNTILLFHDYSSDELASTWG